jgi:hypothetical protein
VVPKVLAHARQVMNDGNAKLNEVGGLPDARQEEELGRGDRSRAQDDRSSCLDFMALSPGPEDFDPDGAAALE